MRLLVVGAEGQVARSLREAAAQDATVQLSCIGRSEIDLLQPATIAPAVDRFRPDVVINPAAYTAVDRAESEPELAFAINRDGAGAVAAAAAARGVPVIHFSTDYVFDGRKPGAYLETDQVDPQGVYGRSKLEGEIAVAAANQAHIILRTSWVYAPFGANFVRTMLRLAGERDQLRVVDDQLGCPTYAPDIARAVLAIARRAAGGWRAEYAGVTNLAGPDCVTWCAFARAIMQQSKLRGGPSVPVVPIATADYPTPAKRPANSSLSTARLGAVFDVALPPMLSSLQDCLDRLLLH